jgi:hypothetical protein
MAAREGPFWLSLAALRWWADVPGVSRKGDSVT